MTAIPGNRDSATIVEAITSLGEGLGLPITAEGVENKAVVDALKRIGSFTAQGYLYGRPEPADQTRKRLSALGLLNSDAAPAEVVAAENPPLSGAA